MKTRFFAFLALLTGLATACYKITLVEQDHEALTGSTFHGKVVVKRSGTSNRGWVKHVYGLFGVCVPEGWQADGTLVMTQVPLPGTNVGDDTYKQTIRRTMKECADYTNLLNRDYPKKGYQWLGFITTSDFKSLFNAEKPEEEVDSIYVEFDIKTNERTGIFHIDYVAGQVEHDKLHSIGVEDRDWNTCAATFEGDNIRQVSYCDTHVKVVRPDGTMDEEPDEIQPEWKLEHMPDGTRKGGSVKAYKDRLYDGLFTRTTGWNGGDGVFTKALPGGNVFWTFNDSFYGIVSSSNRARGNCNFPRNSIMVQTADEAGFPGETQRNLCWLADYVNWNNATAERYFHCRTHLRNPLATLSEADIARGDIDQDYLYWSGDGHIVDGKLQYLWFAVDNRDGQMINIGTTIATYNLDGPMPTAYYNRTRPDYLPHEGDYLHLDKVDHFVNHNPVSYGSTLCDADDGHTYLYGNNAYRTVVARTATHDLYSEWQYYVRDTKDGEFRWQDEYPTDEQLENSNVVENNDGLNLPWVFYEPLDQCYYLVSQGSFFSRKVWIYRSENPYGPFTDRRLLFILPPDIDKIGDRDYHWLYMVNIHPALSRKGELVLTTNTDPDDFWKNFNEPGSADYYRPYFYRVFNWRDLYTEHWTGIEDTGTGTQKAENGVYTLMGMKLNSPLSGTRHLSKGVYIVNGKKKVVR